MFVNPVESSTMAEMLASLASAGQVLGIKRGKNQVFIS